MYSSFYKIIYIINSSFCKYIVLHCSKCLYLITANSLIKSATLHGNPSAIVFYSSVGANVTRSFRYVYVETRKKKTRRKVFWNKCAETIRGRRHILRARPRGSHVSSRKNLGPTRASTPLPFITPNHRRRRLLLHLLPNAFPRVVVGREPITNKYICCAFESFLRSFAKYRREKMLYDGKTVSRKSQRCTTW